MYQPSRKKFKLRFFFDWGAGGCLWSDDNVTRNKFGYGPIDADRFDKTGQISDPAPLVLPQEIKKLIQDLDAEEATYLNSDYQMDPSLWRQKQCDQFNHKIDHLLDLLTEHLADDFEIIDEQERFVEDPDFDIYLKDPKGFSRN